MTHAPAHLRQDVQIHLPLVRTIASRIRRRLPQEVELDDLVGEGTLGLLAAARTYDGHRSVPFEAYAQTRIRGAILDSLRSSDWVPRSVRSRSRQLEEARATVQAQIGRAPTDRELADELHLGADALDRFRELAEVRAVVSLDAPSADATPLADRIEDEDPGALEHLLDEEQRRAVLAAIRALPERERAVVSLAYFHGLTLKEVGQTLGVTESRACQLRGQAIRALRRALGIPDPRPTRPATRGSRNSVGVGATAPSTTC